MRHVTFLIVVGLSTVLAMGTTTDAWARRAGTVRHANGIRFNARPKGQDLVVITWNVSRRVRRQADSYDFQYWTDGEWYTFLGTHQPTSKGIPVVARLPENNARFCLRMVATGEYDDDTGEGSIVGSGTAGNEGPCR